MSTSCDVLIIGGGAAGLAAGVAAARAGCDTLIVERCGGLGGMASAALVHSICGLYRLSSTSEAIIAHEGFAAEFAERLLQSGGAWSPTRMGRVDVLMHHPPSFTWLCDQFVGETAHLRVALHSELTSIQCDRSVRSVDISCRGVTTRIEPRVVVDASGDGVTAALAATAFEQEHPQRLQRPAYIFALGGVAGDVLSDDRKLRLAGQLTHAVHDEELPRAALGASFRGLRNHGELYVTIDLDRPAIADSAPATFDPTEPACLTDLETHGRAVAMHLARWLQQHVDGFERSYIAALPARVGIRESRRLVGEYRIEAEDLRRGARFDDSIGLATWPMELRETTRGPRLNYPENDAPCEIPLRALRVRDLDNVWMAGRCISCSHEAQASIRVIGTCLVTGEVAGLAAALMVDRLRHEKSDGNRIAISADAVNEARSQLMKRPLPS